MLIEIALFVCFCLESIHGNVRLNGYKDDCSHIDTSPYHIIRETETRSSIECVSLCQQDDQCSSVHYHNNQCSLFIGNETSCDERTVPRTAGHKYLEKVSSNWCSNGGQMIGNKCQCTSSQYAGQFCQIGKIRK